MMNRRAGCRLSHGGRPPNNLRDVVPRISQYVMTVKYGAWCASAVVALLCVGGASAAGVIFRYLPKFEALSSAVSVRNIEIGPYLDPRELTARGPGGWGYDPAWAAEFDGQASAIWEDGDDDSNQPFGPNISTEIWIRVLDVGGVQTLVTNRVGAGDGFTLGLQEGIPFFEIAVAGETYRVDGTTGVGESRDVWIAATAAYESSGSLELSIYLNGRLEDESTIAVTIPSPYTVRHPFYVATEAAGTDDAPELSGTITGLVYSAVVRDYVALDEYLSTPPPFDGSTYFGLPDFHDYELVDFHLPMDQRIYRPEAQIRQMVFLPHVNDEFIPQGTAVVSDDTGAAELIYVAYYHRTRDDRLRVQRSIVAEIDAETGSIRRTFRLTGRLETSHAGGIAIAAGALYVSSAGYLERYPIPSFEDEDARYVDLAPDVDGSMNVQSKSSFVSEFADTLWVGDYRTGSEQQPYLYGYPLDASGRLIRSADPYIYPIPRRIQGIDMFMQDGTTYVFMSRNRNSNEGEVLRFRRQDLDSNSIPSWEVSITVPHGVEDLSFTSDGTLWTNAESGTDFYQRNAEWSTFYPFAYGVNRDGLVPLSTSDGIPEEPPGRIRLNAFPNPAADRVHVEYVLLQASDVRIRVIDSLGRAVVTLVEGMRAAGVYETGWDAHRTAQGIYLIIVEAGEHRRFQTVAVIH